MKIVVLYLDNNVVNKLLMLMKKSRKEEATFDALKVKWKISQEVSNVPKALTNEELPTQKQASSGPYQLNCKKP